MRKKCTKCRKCKNFGKILLRFWKYFAKSYHFYAGLGLLGILYFKACTIKNGQLGAKVLKGGMGGGSDEVVQKAKICGYFFKHSQLKLLQYLHFIFIWNDYDISSYFHEKLCYQFIFSWKIMPNYDSFFHELLHISMNS